MVAGVALILLGVRLWLASVTSAAPVIVTVTYRDDIRQRVHSAANDT